MLSLVTEWVRDAVAAVRIADLVDIALVALFVYALLGWLRRGASAPAARRAYALAFVAGGVYLLTRAFALVLVSGLLQVLLLVALVAVVVVFQQELRRFLTRLGTWTPWRPDVSAAPADPWSAELVEAIADLAERRVGALVALRGREPWSEHLKGGVELDGVPSRPLLDSLFDAGTPGHDGAALIEGGRISRFAVHLPMASELPEASRYGGTRHAAALGLSEVCDALVIAVSEERGTVSVAEGGELTELGAAGELAERLERFRQRDGGANGSNRTLRAPGTALLSLGLALLLWLLFAYSPDRVVRTFSVPVEVRDVPEEWTAGEIEPGTVAVTVRGPTRAFEGLESGALAASIELAEPAEGVNRLSIEESSVQLPARLSVLDVAPREVRVRARRLVATDVRVEVPTVGQLPGGATLARLEPRPARVRVLVPADAPPPERVLTRSLDLGDVPTDVGASGRTTLRLDLPAEWRLPPETSGEIAVTIELDGEPGEATP